MKWFPYETWVIESPLSHEVLRKAMSARIEKPDRLRLWHHFLGNTEKHKPLEGTVKGRNFTLRRVIYHRNSFQPYLYGRFKPNDHGTTLIMSMTLHSLTIAFFLLWFGVLFMLSVLIFFVGTNGLTLLVPLGFLLFAVILVEVGFHSEANQTKALFSELLADIHAAEGVTNQGASSNL
jgi:hypothetical protein